MITIDITLVIHIINILFLIGILNAVLYKPVRTVLAQRQESLNGLAKEIDTLANNAKLRQEEITKKLNDARIKAKAVTDEAKGSAQTAGAEVLAAIRKEAASTKTTQLAEIQKQLAGARETLKGQIDGFAAEMAAKILGRSL
ncbi:MAG: hypothetical protein A2521_14705 [Deltaproteobacteria bacterium RIFOXYD12_FULL_57_12]|nr:MAG: hypothetical protein A2521_14705 [Deltaproteobacteria bacterium RIFOXYD12_FULL_57_12]